MAESRTRDLAPESAGEDRPRRPPRRHIRRDPAGQCRDETRLPPADFVLHNSLFLVAHFHNVIIGGVLFGAFAGYNYWFPKAFGFRLDDRWGKTAFWLWVIGFYVAFMPL